MEICKYKNTIRIAIFDDKVEFMPCGIIDYNKQKGITTEYKIKNLSDNLQKEALEVAPKCANSTLTCKRKVFKFKKVEIYVKTSNKKSIFSVLDKLKNNNLTHIIFWSIPNKKVDEMIFEYIRSLESKDTKNIIYRIQRPFNNNKLKEAITRTFEENIYFEVIEDIADIENITNKFKLNTQLNNFKLLDKYKLIKRITIPISNKKGFKDILNKIKTSIPKKFYSLISFYPKGIYLMNFEKFENGSLFGSYNPSLFDEDARGDKPYIIRYKGPKSNLDFNTFEVVSPNKKVIAEVNRKEIEKISSYINKKDTINLFLDLKSDYKTQVVDYMNILNVLSEHSIFELILGKSEILKFDAYKVLYYLSTEYFLIIESLDPDPELISNFKETLNFQVFGVAQNIEDWKKLQPLVEQKYIDRIIYIEYDKNNFEHSKKESENYYKYVDGISSILYDRFYIYLDYMIENDEKEMKKFYKEHNDKRRPYYE